MPRRLLIILGFLCAVAALSGGVWHFGLNTALARLAERGHADLDSAAERLKGQLQRYRQIAVQLADHPDLPGLALSGEAAPRVRALMLRIADQSGAYSIALYAPDGTVLAASDPAATTQDDPNAAPDTAPGTTPDSAPDTAPAFRRALHGALGAGHAVLLPPEVEVDADVGPEVEPEVEAEVGAETEARGARGQGNAGAEGATRRLYTFAAPVFHARVVVAVVVVRVDMETIEESNWRSGPEAIWFYGADGRIFISNRSELLYRFRPSARASSASGPAFEAASEIRRAGLVLWNLPSTRYIPARAIFLTQPLPVLGLTGEALIDTTPAERLALFQALSVAGLCLAFGALLFVATERRRTLAEANAMLEERVQRRTRALSDANESLTRAQEDLVQAGKLSALGQMSAGISHELNQPLMAIGSYAENAGVYLARDNGAAAAENLTRIGELTHRMGRIIRNLRAFARQESEPVGRVDVGAAVTTALELTEAHIRHGGVTLEWAPPATPVFARAGEVRLVQVFVNLITNAVDAMAQSDPRHLRIVINSGRKLAVTVRDTGPGIEAPEKIFEPFYSTKEVGRDGEEGMGLGLSISYGLVQSFGGEIRGRNAGAADGPSRGAMMTVDLEYFDTGSVSGSVSGVAPGARESRAVTGTVGAAGAVGATGEAVKTARVAADPDAGVGVAEFADTAVSGIQKMSGSVPEGQVAKGLGAQRFGAQNFETQNFETQNFETQNFETLNFVEETERDDENSAG